MELLMAKGRWQVGDERKVVDGGADKDGNEILHPPSETFPEKLACHGI